MDEAGIQQYIYRESGKGLKGQRVYGEISGKRYLRTSIIAGLNNEKNLIAPFLFEGMTDTALVLWWTKNLLLKELPENSIIVWDNATFHKSQELRQVIEQAGHTMLFLPPYSPDLNPIEHKWHELKQRLRSFYDNNIDFYENLIRETRVMSMFMGN
jgi:transposase